MTNEKFMPDASQSERIQVLQDTAAKVEDTQLYVPLTQEELDAKREKLTENLIALDQANEEFDVVKEEHKGKVKPLQAENATLITQVRTGQELRKGTFYHLADYDESVMRTYDSDGLMIAERRLRPEEKKGQSRLFSINKTGTEG